MEKPLVTVMMPAYNGAQYIFEALWSVLNQTYTNWELIVLDDCSDDDTYEIVKLLAEYEPRIRHFKSNKRLGIARARNKLLMLAKGDLVGHLDHDDFLHQRALGKIVAEFQKNPEMSLIYSDYINIDSNGNIIKLNDGLDFDRGKLAYFGFRHFTMYKKNIALNLGGFNEYVSGCEDGDLFMRIAERFPCRRLPKFLYFYRSHDTNFSHKKPTCKDCKKQQLCNYFKIWKRELKIQEQKQKLIHGSSVLTEPGLTR